MALSRRLRIRSGSPDMVPRATSAPIASSPVLTLRSWVVPPAHQQPSDERVLSPHSYDGSCQRPMRLWTQLLGAWLSSVHRSRRPEPARSVH